MGFEFDEQSGVITETLMHGGKNEYNTDVDIKAFLKELHDLLYDMGFRDYHTKKNVGVKHFKPHGEEPQAKLLKRTPDMYETKFVWLDKGKGQFEVEFHWVATRPTEMFGEEAYITFSLGLVNRFMVNKEITQGENTKVLQSGPWEHRNTLEYENNVVKNKKEKLEKIPFLSTDFVMKLYANIFLKSQIEHDIELMDNKINGKLSELIKKHFSSL